LTKPNNDNTLMFSLAPDLHSFDSGWQQYATGRTTIIRSDDEGHNFEESPGILRTDALCTSMRDSNSQIVEEDETPRSNKKTNNRTEFDIIVVGGGAGLSGIASPAARSGLRVCVIEVRTVIPFNVLT
jgi:alkyl hydroperoxide reductase subunit AhpF